MFKIRDFIANSFSACNGTLSEETSKALTSHLKAIGIGEARFAPQKPNGQTVIGPNMATA